MTHVTKVHNLVELIKPCIVIQVNISQHHTPPSSVPKLGQAPAKHGAESGGRVLGTNRSGRWCLLKGTFPEANGNTGRLCFSFFRPPSLTSFVPSK